MKVTKQSGSVRLGGVLYLAQWGLQNLCEYMLVAVKIFKQKTCLLRAEE